MLQIDVGKALAMGGLLMSMLFVLGIALSST